MPPEIVGKTEDIVACMFWKGVGGCQVDRWSGRVCVLILNLDQAAGCLGDLADLKTSGKNEGDSGARLGTQLSVD